MKALELLLQYQYADEIGGGMMKEELDEAIAELEEFMKPKRCECFEDVIFVWNETGNFIESIVLNTKDSALDIKKNYRVCIEEIKETL